MRHALLLICLALVQGCVAPAASDVAANHASRLLDVTSSPTSSSSTSDVCDNLDNCRGLVSIITSCLATIFACVWAAVHPNLPGPKQTWMSRQFESFKIIVVTLLVPEWVLAWGMRQSLQAHHYTHILRREAAEVYPWMPMHVILASMGGFHYYRGEEPMFPLQVEGGVVRVDRANEGRCLLTLVKSRSLVPPTWQELQDKSKGNTLSKSITELQTLWFVSRCIARHHENLAITNLEIMTLAYTVITVAMKVAWWNAPLNVRCAIRVQGERAFDTGARPLDEFVQKPRPFEWSDIIHYVTGNQDRLTTLSDEERVPTFWSGCTADSDGELPPHAIRSIRYANIFGLTATVIFGALHCAAWSYAFPSLAEKLMWRVCALAMTVIPVPMAVVFLVFNPIRATERSDLSAYIHRLCMTLCVLLYILARIFLLAISFTCLRHLPPSAYQSVQWTAFAPHI
ncbi:hypothetical protein FIBSPDRAFT_720262 [Athelia psychrophila]|uniref:Uncharacterized protein n=1 Tax=Athelia psychrophila TaxID=1759441 RepID=A0A166WPY3_9AGAM|nr:hypothetical protein FIBSPDRAFT_720262 [Fibularhizoctonia sp. CBS 109695]